MATKLQFLGKETAFTPVCVVTSNRALHWVNTKLNSYTNVYFPPRVS